MGKIRLKKYRKVAGHSILEVTVSTIIILVAFLMFSSLLSQLFSSRRIVPETIILLKQQSLKMESGTTDTTALTNDYMRCKVTASDELLNSFPMQYISITDQNTGKILFQYHTLTDTMNANLLFQQ